MLRYRTVALRDVGGMLLPPLDSALAEHLSNCAIYNFCCHLFHGSSPFMKTHVFFLPNHLTFKPRHQALGKDMSPLFISLYTIWYSVLNHCSFTSFCCKSALGSYKRSTVLLHRILLQFMLLKDCQLYVPQPQLKLPHPLSSHKTFCCRNRCYRRPQSRWVLTLYAGFHVLNGSWSWNRWRRLSFTFTSTSTAAAAAAVSASSAELSCRPHLRSLSTYHRLILIALVAKLGFGLWLGGGITASLLTCRNFSMYVVPLSYLSAAF